MNQQQLQKLKTQITNDMPNFDEVYQAQLDKKLTAAKLDYISSLYASKEAHAFHNQEDFTSFIHTLGKEGKTYSRTTILGNHYSVYVEKSPDQQQQDLDDIYAPIIAEFESKKSDEKDAYVSSKIAEVLQQEQEQAQDFLNQALL